MSLALEQAPNPGWFGEMPGTLQKVTEQIKRNAMLSEKGAAGCNEAALSDWLTG